MENASKALTMAGGILIAMMLVGLFMFGFQRIRNYQNTKDQATKVAQITEFNEQLEAFNKNVVPGYQIISLAHLIRDINTRSTAENFDAITLKVDLKPGVTFGEWNSSSFGNNIIDSGGFIDIYDANVDNKDYIKVFKQFKEQYFKCTDVQVNDKDGRIKRMEFVQITKNTGG